MKYQETITFEARDGHVELIQGETEQLLAFVFLVNSPCADAVAVSLPIAPSSVVLRDLARALHDAGVDVPAA